MTELEIRSGVATILVNCEPTCTFDIPKGVSTIQVNGVTVSTNHLFAYWNIDAWRIQCEMFTKELTRRFRKQLKESELI